MSKILLILVGVAVVGAAIVLILLPPRGGADAVVAEPTAVEAAIDEALDEATGSVAVESEPETVEVEVVEPESEPEVVLVEHVVDGTITEGEYPHRTSVIGVDVYWRNNAEHLRVGLVSPGTGYVALGFDPEVQMQGANMIIGFMQEGELYIRDDYGTQTTEHTQDTDLGGLDNILASAGSEWPDQTVIEFIIPLDSGDAYDKPLVAGNTYPILVSYHDLRDGFSARHSGRGAAEITLDAAE